MCPEDPESSPPPSEPNQDSPPADQTAPAPLPPESRPQPVSLLRSLLSRERPAPDSNPIPEQGRATSDADSGGTAGSAED